MRDCACIASHLHIEAQLLSFTADNVCKLIDTELLSELVEHTEFTLVGGVVNGNLDAANCRQKGQ